MKLRGRFFPNSLIDWACFLFILICLPIVFIFEMVIVLPEFHEPWGFAHALTCVMAFFLVFNITGNMMASMVVDTSVDHKIVKSPDKAVEMFGWRHCEKCDQLSPPRSWHCKVCRLCILKRDHHCFFTGCCIGHRNYRYFFMFVLYLFVGATYAFVYNSLYFWVLKRSFYWSWLTLMKLVCPMIAFADISANRFNMEYNYILFYSLNILALIFALVMLVSHAQLVWKGSISSEHKNSDRRYDAGWRSNLRSVFGDRMHLVWLSPFIESHLPNDGFNWMPSKSTKTAQIVVENKKNT